jgi:hypothetical protein
LALSRAWLALKQRVTLVRMPSAVSALTAFMPSAPMGIFTTTLSWILASSRPSAMSPGASRETHSALTGPSTMEQISRMVSSSGRLALASRVGLVVTPSTQPMS